MRFVETVLSIALTLVGIGCGGGHSSTAASIPVVSHVLLLVEENHSFSSVIGNSSMPYTNSLAQQFSLATQYYANTHNSLPNYFMLTAGNLITPNDQFTGTVSSDNVVRALTSAGKSWKAYMEGLPNAGYTGADVIPYARHHDPFVFFSDVVNSGSQAANIVPFTQLAADLKNGTLPDYAMIVPNLADDGHDCPNEASSCTDTQKLTNVDQWVQANLSQLIQNAASQNSVLIYTWDESDISDTANGGGHVATILIGAKVRTGYQSKTMYQHESTLKLTMQLLGVTDYPGAAGGATDMGEFF